ncbi:MAG: hypothetical protein JXQ87_11275 [Bacteroidia bacterium]
MKQDLFYNILTFQSGQEKLVLYFSTNEEPNLVRVHIKALPNEVAEWLLKQNPEAEHAYTSFTEKQEGLTPFELIESGLSIPFARRYYSWKLENYFSKEYNLPVRRGLINELQVWVYSQKNSDAQFSVYFKYTIKVQYKTVSKGFELLISFDGRSKVFKESSVSIGQNIGTDAINWVLYNGELTKWKRLHEDPNHKIDYAAVHPVLNKGLEQLLEIPVVIARPENKYKKYLNYICVFRDKFLKFKQFQEVLILDSLNFLKVPTGKVHSTSYTSNQLEFGNSHVAPAPKFALNNCPPFEQSKIANTTMFFIMSRDDVKHAFKIKEQFEKGFESFKGLYNYVNLVLNVQNRLSIIFDNKENPLPEIESKLAVADFKPGVRYVAIYLTPFSKFERDKEKRRVYYRVKEMLLKRNITSQVINPESMVEQGANWKYSLPNIAIALLAKLEGVPWRLNIPVKKDLVIGIGAFRHQEDNTQYIGSSFSFSNDGRFNEFEYYQKSEMDVLAGQISQSVQEYATFNETPSRIIIHFYKVMSEKELRPILKELRSLDLGDIPVLIVTINKTEAEDIVAFDANWEGRMPASGTIVNIGYRKYLLFNNTRYGGNKVSNMDGFPFPVKLKIQCSKPELEQDVKVVKELIDQVYQFSRMYWKSLRQQNLPVTIKYPEMVAQIAPYFNSPEIPPFGKRNLWFL